LVYRRSRSIPVLDSYPPGLDRGEWPASHPGHFIPRDGGPVSTDYEAGWVSETVWPSYRREKSCVRAASHRVPPYTHTNSDIHPGFERI